VPSQRRGTHFLGSTATSRCVDAVGFGYHIGPQRRRGRIACASATTPRSPFRRPFRPILLMRRRQRPRVSPSRPATIAVRASSGASSRFGTRPPSRPVFAMTRAWDLGILAADRAMLDGAEDFDRATQPTAGASARPAEPFSVAIGRAYEAPSSGGGRRLLHMPATGPTGGYGAFELVERPVDPANPRVMRRWRGR